MSKPISKKALREHFSEELLWEIAQDVLETIEKLPKSRFDFPMGDTYDEYACRKIVNRLKKQIFKTV